jgi:hypothetical protein
MTSIEENSSSEEADTLIIAAQNETFYEVFLGQGCWYPLRLGDKRKQSIKWIAAYQGRPVSGISFYAKVERIEDYLDTGRYKIVFSDPIELSNPIRSGKVNTEGIQGHRYTTLRKLKAARCLDDLKPWN